MDILKKVFILKKAEEDLIRLQDFLTRGYAFKIHSTSQFLRKYTSELESSRKIYNYFLENSLWHNELKSYEFDVLTMSSISANIIGGFLLRNFELNGYQLKVTNESFDITFRELQDFLNKDNLDITTFLSLHGATGDLEEIKLSEGISIRKAEYEIVKLFGLFYSNVDVPYYVEMYEGDYVLQIDFKVTNKNDFRWDIQEQQLINKWVQAPLLCEVGNIEFGKIIRISSDWPLATIKAPSSPIQKVNPYGPHKKSKFRFRPERINEYKNIAEVISKTDFSKVNFHISHSIIRLKKSKASQNIYDRIVELALALEYLITTESRGDVTMQICLKTIKLLDDNNIDKFIFKKLVAFYDLRSQVIHGTKEVEESEKNNEIIDYAETVILKIIARILSMQQYYSFEIITQVLKTALFVIKPLEELLDQQKSNPQK